MRGRRKQVLHKLKETLSLSPLLNDLEWGDAVTLAIAETGLDAFPEAYPGILLACSPTTGFLPICLRPAPR